MSDSCCSLKWIASCLYCGICQAATDSEAMRFAENDWNSGYNINGMVGTWVEIEGNRVMLHHPLEEIRKLQSEAEVLEYFETEIAIYRVKESV